MSNKTLSQMEMIRFFERDEEEMGTARERAIGIHHTHDIDAAGDEVEVVVREILKRRLAQRYYVGHGHIIDKMWTASPQLDIIIAEAAASPMLFTARNGMQYFPYEPVYAFGEVKSTYYKSKEPIRKFSETIGKIRSQLDRNQTPPNMVAPNFYLGANFNIGITDPYRNPLFTFMIFVNSGNFSKDDVVDLYSTSHPSILPTIVCFVDKATVARYNCVKESNEWRLAGMQLHPEFAVAEGYETVWGLSETGGSSGTYSTNFLSLFQALDAHLRSVVLDVPDMSQYSSQVTSSVKVDLIAPPMLPD